jgi:hypothetical protein
MQAMLVGSTADQLVKSRPYARIVEFTCWPRAARKGVLDDRVHSYVISSGALFLTKLDIHIVLSSSQTESSAFSTKQ